MPSLPAPARRSSSRSASARRVGAGRGRRPAYDVRGAAPRGRCGGAGARGPAPGRPRAARRRRRERRGASPRARCSGPTPTRATGVASHGRPQGPGRAAHPGQRRGPGQGRQGRGRARARRHRGRPPGPRPGQHPAADLPPAEFADRARWPRPRRPGVKVEVLDEKALKKGGYGGILGVGQGSARAAAPGQDGLHRPRRGANGTSRWSARASRSTPAACRSSRPRRWRR